MMTNPIEHNEILKAQLAAARDVDEDEVKLEELLTNWGRWMTSQSLPPQFHVEARSVGEGYKHYGETDYRELDIRLARTVNAVIGDNQLLTPMQRQSLHVAYVGGRWPWAVPMDNYLALARSQVRAGCIAKSVFH